MKIAIIHDWLVVYAGAERVLEELLRLYPDADLFCVVDFLPKSSRDFLDGRQVRTTFVQKLPFAKTKYRNYLSLMPFAIEQHDLSKYDLVISSSHAVAKGVLTGPNQLHLSYIHSPIRYAWDLQHQYLAEAGLEKSTKGWLARYLLHRIRKWDVRTSNGVDYFIANSNFIARRIHKIYRRESTVIYPPVDTGYFSFNSNKEDYYLAASRMVPYKRMDLVVEAFSKFPGKKLVVIGDGPEFKKVKAKGGGNVQFLGYQDQASLRRYMQKAKAFVFAAEEDFGIAPVEAQACGTPVIAYGRGGALETVQGLETNNPTGVFFHEQTPESLLDGLETFEKNQTNISPADCRQNSLKFSTERFQSEFSSFVNRQWQEFSQIPNNQPIKRHLKTVN